MRGSRGDLVQPLSQSFHDVTGIFYGPTRRRVIKDAPDSFGIMMRPQFVNQCLQVRARIAGVVDIGRPMQPIVDCLFIRPRFEGRGDRRIGRNTSDFESFQKITCLRSEPALMPWLTNSSGGITGTEFLKESPGYLRIECEAGWQLKQERTAFCPQICDAFKKNRHQVASVDQLSFVSYCFGNLY